MKKQRAQQVAVYYFAFVLANVITCQWVVLGVISLIKGIEWRRVYLSLAILFYIVDISQVVYWSKNGLPDGYGEREGACNNADTDTAVLPF